MKLKKSLRLPMVLLCLTTALMAAISLVLYKSFGELATSPTSSPGEKKLEGSLVLSISLVMGALLAAIGQIYLLNVNLKYYSNLDLMPVYQACILISNMACGLVLLNEV